MNWHLILNDGFSQENRVPTTVRCPVTNFAILIYSCPLGRRNSSRRSTVHDSALLCSNTIFSTYISESDVHNLYSICITPILLCKFTKAHSRTTRDHIESEKHTFNSKRKCYGSIRIEQLPILLYARMRSGLKVDIRKTERSSIFPQMKTDRGTRTLKRICSIAIHSRYPSHQEAGYQLTVPASST